MKILKFLKYPLGLKILVVRVFFLALFYKWLISKNTFRDICHRLGTRRESVPYEPYSGNNKERILAVSRAIKIVCPRLHFKNECLVEAFVAKRLLLHEKMTVYMGVAKNKDGAMRAHAWTRCGDIYVTGAEGREQFTVTAVFA